MMPQSSVFIVRYCGKINIEINIVHEIFHSITVRTFQTWFLAVSLKLLKLTHKIGSA